MKILIGIIGCIFLFPSCTSDYDKNSDVYGTYKSVPTPFKYKLMGYFNYELGGKIRLDSNNRFTLISCGDSILGYWRLKNDSLGLFYTMQYYKSRDSVAYFDHSIEDTIYEYQLVRDRIIKLDRENSSVHYYVKRINN